MVGERESRGDMLIRAIDSSLLSINDDNETVHFGTKMIGNLIASGRTRIFERVIEGSGGHAYSFDPGFGPCLQVAYHCD
jgi:hypothetical protein